MTMMTAQDVVAVMARLIESGIEAWLDGGWAVDALLGEQTREHEDLDLVVELAQVDRIQEALRDLGYEMTEDERPTRLVLTAPGGSHIDLHTVVFDEGGGGIQTLQDGRTYRYPPEGFHARGEIAGQALSCLTPEVQIECHTGYEPTDTDRHDVRLLTERFNLPVPKAYR
jgi:lincosamide nucleotidyltransferase A/C/D/E